ncbi:MAG: efflux RND transporter periplasmic adaptor subunit [Chitinophagaceae bacterium]
MQQIHKIMVLAITVVSLTACNSKGDNAIAKKKAELATLKEQQTKLVSTIATLEAEIYKLDPSSRPENTKLVAVAAVTTDNFAHFIDLQGKIEAVNISYITPKNGGGQVRALFVKKGDAVKKGQLLLQLDNTIAKQSVIASEQSLQITKSQLAFAKTIYQKQKNLWEQNIGTEVQLLTAKNNVETLEAQLKSQEEQVKLSKEQLGFCNVYSDVSGVAEDVNVRVGEFFTGIIQGIGAQIKIVNTDNLKVTAEIPENYANKVGVGSKMKVSLPDIGKTYEATISVANKLINASSRTFYVEAKIPSDKIIRPNQIALINIQDYNNSKAITIPVNTQQNDDKGKFVMVAVKEGNKLIAKKKAITTGDFYGDKLEIKSGLAIGDQIIIEGYQGLYDGQLITTK